MATTLKCRNCGKQKNFALEGYSSNTVFLCSRKCLHEYVEKRKARAYVAMNIRVANRYDSAQRVK